MWHELLVAMALMMVIEGVVVGVAERAELALARGYGVVADDEGDGDWKVVWAQWWRTAPTDLL